MSDCKRCRTPNTKHLFFCHSCGKLLPVETSNYFELFGVSIGDRIDLENLNERLFELQSKLHPDNFIGDSIEELSLSIEHSQKINEAYQTLKNPIKRMNYGLKLIGANLEKDWKALPQDYAIEAFELREKTLELVTSEEKKEFIDKVREQQKELLLEGESQIKSQSKEQALRIFAKIMFLESILKSSELN
jgi:molecular chaperone HscB